MPYIQPEVILEAKKVDLLTYLQNYEPQELVHVSGGEYTTKTHDSLRISNNGLWNWCSQGIGGKTALDYLIKVKGFSFMDAVEQIVGHTAIAPPVLVVKKEKSPKVLIISDPKILFLDEPTLGLDVLARRELWAVIRKLKGKTTIILIIHYMEEAEALSDRIGIMSKGALKAIGTAMELMTQTNTKSFEDAFVTLAAETEGIE